MIQLDMTKKATSVYADIAAFSGETGILTLPVSLGTYSLTGKTVTAVFLPKAVETAALSIVEGVIQIPINSNVIAAGLNRIQLYIYSGATVEQSPIMRATITQSLIATAPSSEAVDLMASLLAQVTSAVDSLGAVQTACEGAALEASGYAADADEDAAAAADLLSQTQEAIGTTICPLGVDGKIPTANLPALSINDTFTVADTTAMLALDAQKGDCAIIMPVDVVTDTYMLAGDSPSVLSNWKNLGVSYVSEAGHAVSADSATNSDKIDGNHLLTMTQAEYDAAVIDASTIYLVG